MLFIAPIRVLSRYFKHSIFKREKACGYILNLGQVAPCIVSVGGGQTRGAGLDFHSAQGVVGVAGRLLTSVARDDFSFGVVFLGLNVVFGELKSIYIEVSNIVAKHKKTAIEKSIAAELSSQYSLPPYYTKGTIFIWR